VSTEAITELRLLVAARVSLLDELAHFGLKEDCCLFCEYAWFC
jgi:hypothetical protein